MHAKKFLSLTPEQQHKYAASLTRTLYTQVCEWLNLSIPEPNPEPLSTRYHLHRTHCTQALREDKLLPPIQTGDKPSIEPYLPITIYLDHLRSAHNVGSILRTIEAFRLGSVAFSPQTPTPDHPKVKRTAMGASVPWTEVNDPATLPGPLIALETSPLAIPLSDFTFPPQFTLPVGNEEYGCSGAILKRADALIQIPLYGSKNSLNVANALAITAATIRQRTA